MYVMPFIVFHSLAPQHEEIEGLVDHGRLFSMIYVCFQNEIEKERQRQNSSLYVSLRM